MALRPALLPLLAALALLACPGPGSGIPDGGYQLSVGAVFDAGTRLRDAYTGAEVTVAADGTVVVVPDRSGVVLLERAGGAAAPAPFAWQSALVYFALTDRFNNGDPTNDQSYGRRKDGDQEVGTWHGGDWKGLTQKLPYLQSMGVEAVWISPIVEQVHGWVAGGGGKFKNYGYAGYWAMDFTRLDQNWGSEDDLKGLLAEAHRLGMKVLVDVVINHPGYATGADLLTYLPGAFKDGTGAAFRALDAQPAATTNWNDWNGLVAYNGPGTNAWCQWWGPLWIRTDLAGPSCHFTPGGSDELTRSLTFLPDFKTESTAVADVPAFLAMKAAGGGSGFTEDLHLTPRQYLVKWHADWVRALGIDGFRVDTVNNVEPAAFGELKTAASAALDEYRLAHGGVPDGGLPFFTVGEAYGHGVVKDGLYVTGKFDALLNFSFREQVRDLLLASGSLLGDTATLAQVYATLGATTSDPGFGVMSYLSSHDMSDLFYDAVGADAARHRQGLTALLLAPGAVQLFYGDESGRRDGPSLDDGSAGTRSDMNWATADQALVAHVTLLGTFRQRHRAVGRGTHAVLPSPAGTWAFSRTLASTAGEDRVVVLLTPPR